MSFGLAALASITDIMLSGVAAIAFSVATACGRDEAKRSQASLAIQSGTATPNCLQYRDDSSKSKRCTRPVEPPLLPLVSGRAFGCGVCIYTSSLRLAHTQAINVEDAIER